MLSQAAPHMVTASKNQQKNIETVGFDFGYCLLEYHKNLKKICIR